MYHKHVWILQTSPAVAIHVCDLWDKKNDESGIDNYILWTETMDIYHKHTQIIHTSSTVTIFQAYCVSVCFQLTARFFLLTVPFPWACLPWRGIYPSLLCFFLTIQLLLLKTIYYRCIQIKVHEKNNVQKLLIIGIAVSTIFTREFCVVCSWFFFIFEQFWITFDQENIL